MIDNGEYFYKALNYYGRLQQRILTNSDKLSGQCIPADSHDVSAFPDVPHEALPAVTKRYGGGVAQLFV